MSVDCGSCVAKYFLCLFNFAFFVSAPTHRQSLLWQPITQPGMQTASVPQILGSVVLLVGIWVAADKSSFIALLKLVESEHVGVSAREYNTIVLLVSENRVKLHIYYGIRSKCTESLEYV